MVIIILLNDSQNRRIALSHNSAFRYTVHDGNIPIAEMDSSGNITKIFVRGVGIAEGTGDVLAELRTEDGGQTTAHFYLANHRGDTLMVLAENGNIEKTIRYDAFGNVSEQTGTFSPRYTFSTKEYLPDAELYLYAYRTYDPIAGRWTQRDPIDYQDSVNLYQFCGNNPVNGIDIDGRIAKEAHKHWIDYASKGISEGGIKGAAKVTVEVALASCIDLFNARGVQDSAEKAGNAAGEGRTAAAIGHLAATVGKIAIEAASAAGAMRASHVAKGTLKAGSKKLFGKGGYLNKGKYFRIGVGRKGGRRVFRITGKIVKKNHWEISC